MAFTVHYERGNDLGADSYDDTHEIVINLMLNNRDHVPMAVGKLAGKTKLVATRVLGSPNGKPPFHRIAEIHFPSMEALEACAASEGGKQTLANAVSISSGGAPVFLVAEEETFEF